MAVLGAMLGLALSGGARAQSTPPQDSAPIVVTAPAEPAPGEKPSVWKRAEADDVVVYSDGDAAQLLRVTRNLERLHALLERLYRTRTRTRAAEPARVEIVLVNTAKDLRALGLRDIGANEGPFAKPFAGQRYYDPRPGGAVIALPRVDQVIDTDTSKARNADCEDTASTSGDGESDAPSDCIGNVSFHPPVTRSWESILYGAYAQHLVIHYAAVAYPRWYFDGIGAVFSTVVFKHDGSVEYGQQPIGLAAVLRAYGRLDTAAVMTGSYLHTPSKRMDWTPYHAWLLTHFFVMSRLNAADQKQFGQYMAAVGRGETMAQAAQAFGTLVQLRREVRAYAGLPHEYAKTVKSTTDYAPTVTPLTQPAAEAMLKRVAGRG
nr:hypothetical protein [uncultured Sphingomonas sp.]